MPYQLNGQLVEIKSQRLPHATGAVTAAGGGAFVTMSAALAALSGAAMSNAETAAMPNEVTFMAFPIRRQFTPRGEFLQRLRLSGRPKLTFTSLFRGLLQLGHSCTAVKLSLFDDFVGGRITLSETAYPSR
jgi:hypothetical protein